MNGLKRHDWADLALFLIGTGIIALSVVFWGPLGDAVSELLIVAGFFLSASGLLGLSRVFIE